MPTQARRISSLPPHFTTKLEDKGSSASPGSSGRGDETVPGLPPASPESLPDLEVGSEGPPPQKSGLQRGLSAMRALSVHPPVYPAALTMHCTGVTLAIGPRLGHGAEISSK